MAVQSQRKGVHGEKKYVHICLLSVSGKLKDIKEIDNKWHEDAVIIVESHILIEFNAGKLHVWMCEWQTPQGYCSLQCYSDAVWVHKVDVVCYNKK